MSRGTDIRQIDEAMITFALGEAFNRLVVERYWKMKDEDPTTKELDEYHYMSIGSGIQDDLSCALKHFFTNLLEDHYANKLRRK